MEFLAILTSMPFESNKILSSLRNISTSRIAGKTVYQARLSKKKILLMNTGIGKVNAAHSATCLIERFRVKHMINLGVGGAYPGAGLKIGDIAVAVKEIYGDEGVRTSKGLEGIKKIGIPLVLAGRKKFYNEFPMDAGFSKKAANITVRRAAQDPGIKTGNFLTVSAATGIQNRAAELGKRFRAICENMEGAAIAQVCAIYMIPMLEIRGISNIAGVRDKRKWNLKLAAENCQRAVIEMIDKI